MRWRGRQGSDNIEDRRGQGPARGGLRIPGSLGGRKGGIGLGGIAVVVILALVFGIDPSALLGGKTETLGGPTAVRRSGGTSAADRELRQFVAVVLKDTEDVWNGLFRRMGRTYEEPRLVLYTGAVRSACGLGQAAMGPFYCPADRKLYLDFSFFRELKRRFKAPGDFAQAYVIAHEVGHHVQTLLGISQKVNTLRRQVSRAEGNALSVRLELQADCFAGVWAHHAQRSKKILDPGDLQEALKAATQIGDDNIQRRTQGRIVPESFTHGTGEQRERWFRRGFDGGDVRRCNTFNASRL